MTSNPTPSVDDLMEQAATWHVQLEDGSADRDAFAKWRDADPRHAAAFARIAGTDALLAGLKPDLTAHYRARAGQLSRRRLLTAASVAGGGLLLAGGLVVGVSGRRAHAETVVGGRETLPLPDGGRLDINTDSQVQWKYDDRQRQVWLRHGEIALTVPKDDRPCRIHAAGQVVETRGAILNVRLREAGTLDVLVLSGDCTLDKLSMWPLSGDGQGKPSRVSSGQTIASNGSGRSLRAATQEDIQFTAGWQTGELILNGETLAVAVEEYNRYLPHGIVIADPGLQGLRLGGRFSSHDPADFLASLQSSFAIRVTSRADGTVVLAR